MTDCNVCLDQGDGESCTLWNVTVRKARKAHKCYECDGDERREAYTFALLKKETEAKVDGLTLMPPAFVTAALASLEAKS